MRGAGGYRAANSNTSKAKQQNEHKKIKKSKSQAHKKIGWMFIRAYEKAE
jgi:hypothetical protein